MSDLPYKDRIFTAYTTSEGGEWHVRSDKVEPEEGWHTWLYLMPIRYQTRDLTGQIWGKLPEVHKVFEQKENQNDKTI